MEVTSSKYSDIICHDPVYSTEFHGTRALPRPTLETSSGSRSTSSSGYQSMVNDPYSYRQYEPQQGHRNFEQLSNIYQGRLLEKPTYSEYMSSKHSSGHLSSDLKPQGKKSETKSEHHSGHIDRVILEDYPGGSSERATDHSSRKHTSSSNVYQKYTRPETLQVHAKDDLASVETISTESYSRLFDQEEQIRRKEYRERVEDHYRRLVGEEQLSPDTASILSDAFAQAEDKAKYKSGLVASKEQYASPVYQVGIDRSVWKAIDHTRSKSIEKQKSSPDGVFERGVGPVQEVVNADSLRNKGHETSSRGHIEEREKMASPYKEITQNVIDSSGKPSGRQMASKPVRPGQRPDPIILPEKGFYWSRQKSQTPDHPRAQSTRSVTSDRSSRLDPHTYQSYAAGILYSSGRSEKFLNLTRHFSVLERISEIEYQAVQRKQEASANHPGSGDPKDYAKMLSIYDFVSQEELKELYTELEEAKKNKEFYYSSCKMDDVQWKPDKDKGLLKKQKSFNDLKTLYVETAAEKDSVTISSTEITARQTPYYQLSEKYKDMEEKRMLEEQKQEQLKSAEEQVSPRTPGPYLQIMQNAAKMTKERPLYGTHIKEFPVNKYEIHVQNIAQKPKPENSLSSLHVRSISAPNKENEERVGNLQRSDSSKESYFRMADSDEQPINEAEVMVTPESKVTGTSLYVRSGIRDDPGHDSTRNSRSTSQRPKSCLPFERNKLRASVKISDLKSKFEGGTDIQVLQSDVTKTQKRPRSVPPDYRSKDSITKSKSEPDKLGLGSEPTVLHRSTDHHYNPTSNTVGNKKDEKTVDRVSRTTSRSAESRSSSVRVSRGSTPVQNAGGEWTEDHQDSGSNMLQTPTRGQSSSRKDTDSLPGSLHAITGHFVNNRSDDQKLDCRFKFSVNLKKGKTSDVPPLPAGPPPPVPPPPPRPLAASSELRNIAIGSYPEESHTQRSRTPQFQVKNLRGLAKNNEFSQSKWVKKPADNQPAAKQEEKMTLEGPVHREPSPVNQRPVTLGRSASSMRSPSPNKSTIPGRSVSMRPTSPVKPVSPMRSTSLNTADTGQEDSDHHSYGQLRKWTAVADHINEDTEQKPYAMVTQNSKDESEGSFGSNDTFIFKGSDEDNKPEEKASSVLHMRRQFESKWDKSKSEPDLASLNDDPYRPRSAKSQTVLNYDSFKEGLKDKDRHGSIKDGSEIPGEVTRGVPRTISGELLEIRKKWEDGDSFGEATKPRFRSKTPSAHLDPAGERPVSSIPRSERIITRPSHYDPYIPPGDILKEVTSVREGRKREEALYKPRKPSSVSKMTLDYFDQIGGEWQQSKNRSISRASSRGPVDVEQARNPVTGAASERSENINHFRVSKPIESRTGVATSSYPNENEITDDRRRTYTQTSKASLTNPDMDFGPPLSRAANPPIPPPPQHPPPPPPLPRPKHGGPGNGSSTAKGTQSGTKNRRGASDFKIPAFRHQTTDVKRAQPVSEKDRRRREEDEVYRKKRLEQLYEEERQRKIRQETADMEARKHSDFFTPSQKSPIPLDRYSDDQILGMSPLPASSVPPERRRGFQIQGRAKVLYNFTAQNPREMSLRKGDVVYLIRQIDKNWLEGERHGRLGIFPVSYIEVTTSIEAAKMAAMQSEGQAQAKYTFTAHTSVELSLKKGEFVVLLRRIDENWFEGKIGMRQGIFPVAYVEVIREPSTPLVTPAPSVITTPMTGTPEMLSPVSYDAAPTPPPQPSPSAFAQRSPTLSFGYRQPSPGGPRSQSSQLSPMLDHEYRSLPRSMQQSPTIGRKPASPSSTMPRHGYGTQSQFDRTPLTNHDFTQKSKVADDDLAIKRYRALYAYRPQNEDELELNDGDEVYVSEKCDDGWYVGTSIRTGQFGTFPGNYVQQI